jgi:hypothetical protein
MNTFKHFRRSVAIGSLLLLPAMEAVSRADTIVVTPGNMSDWTFYSFDSNGDSPGDPGNVGALVTGPATPPLGIGSAELATGTGAGDGSEQIRNTDYQGIKLSALTSLSYWTYMSQNTNNGQQMPYLELYINTTGVGATAGSWDDRLSFEPPYQTPATGNPSLPNQGNSVLDTWQGWNALTGGWYDDNNLGSPGTYESPSNPGVISLATYLETYPDATIVNAAPGEGGVRVSVGYADAGDTFVGNIDDFTIGTADATTTYDFEPASVPKPASAGLLLVGSAAALMRRRRRRPA